MHFTMSLTGYFFALRERETRVMDNDISSAVSGTGPSAHPASPSGTSTRSQRSIESRSVESFFGSR